MNHNLIPTILTSIQNIRKDFWNLQNNFNEEAYFMLATSSRKNIKKQAINLFISEQEKKSFTHIQKSKKVNLLEKFEKIDKKTQRRFLKNLIAIELVRGCTGQCPFCVSQMKPIITAKYSFKSLQKFYKRYSKYIPPKNNLWRNIIFKKNKKIYQKVLLYWDTDPFLYSDKDKKTKKIYSIFDVYELMINYGKGKITNYLSTTIAPGSQKNFIVFCLKIIEKHIEKSLNLPHIRLSVARHNVQRIETILYILYQLGLHRYKNQKKFLNSFEQMFSLSIRDKKTVMPVGALIKNADPMKDFISPSSDDGVVLSPNNTRSLTMIAATKYNSVGAKAILLKPGNVTQTTSKYKYIYDYAFYFDLDSGAHHIKNILPQLKKLITKKQIFLPLPENINNSPYIGSPNDLQKDKFSLFLPRYMLSLRHFLLFTSQLKLATNIPSKILRQYFQLVKIQLPIFQKEIEKTLKKTKKYNTKYKDREIAYYIKATEFQVNITSKLLKEIQENKDMRKTLQSASKLEKTSL